MAWRFQAPCCLLAYAPRQAHIPIIPTMRPIIRAAASPPSNAETWSKRQAKTIAKNTWNTPPAAIFDFTCNTKRHVMSHVWCHCPVGMKTYRVGVVRISFAFDFSNVLSQKWIIYFFTQIAVYAINIFVFFQTYVWHIYICTHLYQGPLMFLSIVHCYLLFVSWYLAGNLRRAAPRHCCQTRQTRQFTCRSSRCCRCCTWLAFLSTQESRNFFYFCRLGLQFVSRNRWVLI